MTLTATYSDTYAKVTLAISGVSSYPSGTTALIERSTDGVLWTTVRGAQAVSIAGGTASFTDYEYSPSIANTYRVSYVDPALPTYQGSAALVTATAGGSSASASLAAWPPSAQIGTVVFAVGACTKATAVVTTATAGWTLAATISSNVKVYSAPYAAGLALPTFTATGTASGDILTVEAFGYLNGATAPVSQSTQVNASSQNIAFPALTSPNTAANGLVYLFKPSINTSLSPAATTNDTATGYTVAGYQALGSTSWGTGSVTVTGGAAAASYAYSAFVGRAAYIARDTASVTPAQSTVWIKNPTRPFLNRAVKVVDVADITRSARTGVFAVIAKQLPIAVTDIQGGRVTTLTVRTLNRTAIEDLESCLLTGETVLVHAPAGAVTPTMYVVLGDLARSRVADTSTVRLLSLPMTEVDQPDLTLAATLSTYQTVLSTYATYSAIPPAKATYADVLTLVGSSSDIYTS